MSIATNDIIRCVQRALPDAYKSTIEIVSKQSGTINDVFEVLVGGERYALRARLRESIFAYEQGLPKEVVVGRYLTATGEDYKRPYVNSDRLVGIIDNVLSRPCGGPIVSPLSPTILFYDISRELIPAIWTLQKWCDDDADSKLDNNHYQKLGAAIAKLHASEFDGYLKRLDQGRWCQGGDWPDALSAEIAANAAELGFEINPKSLSKIFDHQALCFVLNHNDIQPLNVLNVGQEVTLIDWDNAQIAPPEFDLVKLKYWTEISDRQLRQCPEKYSLFLNSYSNSVEKYDINFALLEFCELVWLLRVATFERRRKSKGMVIPAPFPAPEYYEKIIKRKMKEIF